MNCERCNQGMDRKLPNKKKGEKEPVKLALFWPEWETKEIPLCEFCSESLGRWYEAGSRYEPPREE